MYLKIMKKDFHFSGIHHPGLQIQATISRGNADGYTCFGVSIPAESYHYSLWR